MPPGSSLTPQRTGHYEQIPFYYLAGNLDPDYDTLANFRKTLRYQIRDLFVQILLLAQTWAILVWMVLKPTLMFLKVEWSVTNVCLNLDQLKLDVAKLFE